MARLAGWVVSPLVRLQSRVSSGICARRARVPSAKLHVSVLTVGRRTAKEQWAEDAVQELVKRLSKTMEVNANFLKDNHAMLETLKRPSRSLGYVVGLDATGKTAPSSEAFSEWLYERFESGGSRITFLIGGSDGLPAEIKKRANEGVRCNEFLSLSRLTFTHKMARLLLVEQVYRASEIRKGTKYNK